MSKTKTITDLVMELQQENESLKKMEKLVSQFGSQYCKMEFNYSVKEIHDIILKQEAYERRVKEREAAQQGQQIRISRSEY